jgi:protein-tyrosine phosphatase
MNKPHNAKLLMEKDIYLQINAGSLLGQYGEKVRQTAWVLLNKGWAHLLSSDNHAQKPINLLPQAINLIKERIDEHTVQLLTQDFPQMIIDDEQIPLFYVYVQKPHHHHQKTFWERIFG